MIAKNISATVIQPNTKNQINTHIQKQKITDEKNKIMPSTNTSTIQVQKRDGRKGTRTDCRVSWRRPE